MTTPSMPPHQQQQQHAQHHHPQQQHALLQQQQHALQLSLLEAERDRLAHSNAHLERSCQELRQALADDRGDPDYKAAVSENLVLIAKQRARIASLDEELRRARGGGGAAAGAHVGCSGDAAGAAGQLAAVPVTGGGAAAAGDGGAGPQHQARPAAPQQAAEGDGVWL